MSTARQLDPVPCGRFGLLRAGAHADGVPIRLYVGYAFGSLWAGGWLAVERCANDESWEPGEGLQ